MEQKVSKNQWEGNKKGETANELVHRHLQDENHVITDEELKNVRLETSVPLTTNETTTEDLTIQDVKDGIDEEVNEEGKDDNKQVVTPWDTING